ncbi:MAG: hypothetical protein WC551_08855 [Patescibacteria group bacterium]
MPKFTVRLIKVVHHLVDCDFEVEAKDEDEEDPCGMCGQPATHQHHGYGYCDACWEARGTEV